MSYLQCFWITEPNKALLNFSLHDILKAYWELFIIAYISCLIHEAENFSISNVLTKCLSDQTTCNVYDFILNIRRKPKSQVWKTAMVYLDISNEALKQLQKVTTVCVWYFVNMIYLFCIIPLWNILYSSKNQRFHNNM